MDDDRIDVFFYGLFMDEQVLAAQRIAAVMPRRAFADGFRLHIGQRASLVPHDGARAYGMIYALTQSELDRLYSQPGLEAYRAEQIAARGLDGAVFTATCYNLATVAESEEASAAYAARLRDVLTRLGFPPEYVSSISSE